MSQQYAKRLDKSRDHGTYHPADGGAHYNQDGYDFDHEGYLVESRLTPDQHAHLAKKKPAPSQAPKPPKAAAAPKEEDDEANHEGGNAEADGLNLEAWLRGEEEYNFDAVRHAVKARYNVWKTGRRDLVLLLVEEQKLVGVDALSDDLKALIA
jgi:hypothetical protein